MAAVWPLVTRGSTHNAHDGHLSWRRTADGVAVRVDAAVPGRPLVVETFGGWDTDAVKHLKKMAVHDARRWGKKDSLEIKHFFQRLSVTLQRGNAALLVERDVEPV